MNDSRKTIDSDEDRWSRVRSDLCELIARSGSCTAAALQSTLTSFVDAARTRFDQVRIDDEVRFDRKAAIAEILAVYPNFVTDGRSDEFLAAAHKQLRALSSDSKLAADEPKVTKRSDAWREPLPSTTKHKGGRAK